jgi:hypothetical protein
LGERGTAFLSGIPGLQHRWDTINPAIHVDPTAGRDDHDRALVEGGHSFNELVLSRREPERAIGPFALAFRVKTNGDDDCVG